MRLLHTPLLPLLITATLALSAPAAHSTDACADRAIVAAAEVDVSDGTSFRVESFYHTMDNMAVRHAYPEAEVRTRAIEGPLAWESVDDRVRQGDDDTKVFALGHQFHALLLEFTSLVPDAVGTVVAFGEDAQPALRGRLPYGGSVSLVGANERPLGMVLRTPDDTTVRATFSDWRQLDDLALPYDMVLDDGERTFSYRFSFIDPRARTPTWYVDEIEAPALDAVRLYRLHRRLLAAHCEGDAAMLGALSAPIMMVISDGQLTDATSLDVQRGFEQLFTRLDYQRYEDLRPPVIEVADSGDLAWVAVEVRARGTVRSAPDDTFDDRWAWVMLARKEKGDWVHAGNAATRRQP
ncbi:MAG: hypothetical protein AAF184_03185 [Pseudomonadota bacterium]